jgi:two-component system, cell cycle sensor histidine kinase and response regulator CckA
MKRPLRVLLIGNSEMDAALLIRELDRAGYDVTHERVATADAMKAALERSWDVVLSDYNLPGLGAQAALAVMQDAGHDIPFIIVSGTAAEEAAVAAVKAGASDFLAAGGLARLAPAIERELQDAAERQQRRLSEGQLRQAQKMEAVGRLAGGVAHDFNNMLTAILGYADLLLEQIGPDKPMGKDIQEIRNAAHRAATLTRQLLAFSRKQVLTVTPVDLTEVVRTVEPMLRRLLGAPINIALTLDDGLDLVMADAAQLEHLVINLAVNARDAMPDGGILQFATQNVALDEDYASAHPGSRAGSFAALSVSDTGVGMSSDVLGKIFDPFFTTKERGRGTGLGLAAVYGTVKQLGGYVEVVSELGEGTTFTIYLPTTDRPRQTPAVVRPSGSPVGHETILLVEDEESVRTFVKNALVRFGYRVIDAESAEAAIALLTNNQTPVHLLLSDVVLPGMPGTALASYLRKDRAEMRVLLMSGYAADRVDDMLAALERAEVWIAKPFSAQALLTKIRQLLG